MTVPRIVNTAAAKIKVHSPEILFATGTIGLCLTIGLALKQAPKIRQRRAEANDYIREHPMSRPKKAIHILKTVGPAAVPIVLSAAATWSCFYGADRLRFARGVQLAGMYEALSSTANAYMEKLDEQLSDDDMEKLKEHVAESLDMPENDYEIDYGEGDLLVFDQVTGRYFKSTQAKIAKAEAEVAKRLVDECIVPLNYFYELLGLDDCSAIGEAIGWSVDGRQLDIVKRSMLDEHERPCLAITYLTKVINRKALESRW